jgi:hypothetical protein
MRPKCLGPNFTSVTLVLQYKKKITSPESVELVLVLQKKKNNDQARVRFFFLKKPIWRECVFNIG